MTKKKIYLLLPFIIVFLSTTGCSIILRRNFPAVKKLPAGWSEMQDKDARLKSSYPAYGFRYKDVLTRLSGSYLPADRVAWFGPPLIPLVPLFILYKDVFGKVTLVMTIESPTETSGFDISQIQVYGTGEKPLRVNTKSIYFRHGSEKPEKLREIPKHPTISKGELFLYIECHSTLSELKRFTVDIGSLNVGEENIRLPPLSFRKQSKYIYGPFVYSNHLNDIYDKSVEDVSHD